MIEKILYTTDADMENLIIKSIFYEEIVALLEANISITSKKIYKIKPNGYTDILDIVQAIKHKINLQEKAMNNKNAKKAFLKKYCEYLKRKFENRLVEESINKLY